MLAKRIIACLDVRSGRVVKGRQFQDLEDQGNPAARAAHYQDEGADEIVFLDVSATRLDRLALSETVRQVASALSIPLTVGGGIRTLEDAKTLFDNGADKVSLNTAAVQDPGLIRKLADAFGAQSVVVAIDAKKNTGSWDVLTHAGTTKTTWDAVTWAQEAQRLGAGELLLTSIDRDGTKEGFDVDLLQAVKDAVGVPVIASGGAGSPKDFLKALEVADAALAAGIFHRNELTIRQVKDCLLENGVNVRL